jgi:hypothetical protein
MDEQRERGIGSQHTQPHYRFEAEEVAAAHRVVKP